MNSLDRMTADTDMLRDFGKPSLDIILAHLNFLIECVQGPCESNQDFIIESTALMVYCKRTMQLAHYKLLKLKHTIKLIRKDENKNLSLVDFSIFDMQKCYVSIFGAALKLILSLLEGRGGDESITRGVLLELNSTLYGEYRELIRDWIDAMDGEELLLPGLACFVTQSWIEEAEQEEVCPDIVKIKSAAKLENHELAAKSQSKLRKLIIIGRDRACKHLQEAAYDLEAIFMQLGSVDPSTAKIYQDAKKKQQKKRSKKKEVESTYNKICRLVSCKKAENRSVFSNLDGNLIQLEFVWKVTPPHPNSAMLRLFVFHDRLRLRRFYLTRITCARIELICSIFLSPRKRTRSRRPARRR